MNSLFISKTHLPTTPIPSAYWLVLRGFKLLVTGPNEQLMWPQMANLADIGLTAVRQHYLGHLTHDPDTHFFVAEVAQEADTPEGMQFEGLRSLYGRMPDDWLWLGGRALQIIDWDRTHLFCGRCGSPNELLAHERAKKCPNCGLVAYPRISPAVIMRITRQTANGSQILLAHGRKHPPGFYSVLAGFVEPGETLETAVRREVKEEVGLEIDQIRYFGSQPWPFPNSLMLAFTAEYAHGQIVLEEEEIDDAQWFDADNLPLIPPPMSISRQLIDDFVAQQPTAVSRNPGHNPDQP